MAQIISIEPITITIQLGEHITRDSFPDVLWCNYDVPPYHGYISMPALDGNLLVLNVYSNAPTASSTNAPVLHNEPIKFDSNGVATNIPVDKQQEILLKGAIKNNVTSGDGISTNGVPVVFYISILVGGIDWNPASRFPAEIDPLEADMKEPVTSADIPQVDAYQYYISLQTRSSSEESMLESLKQSLAKKMIMAKDINWLRNCTLAIENAYFALIDTIKKLVNRVDFLEFDWMPDLASRVYLLELENDNLWDNMQLNWQKTAKGLYTMGEDCYTRVYHGLKHYGSKPTDGGSSGAWFSVPMFGSKNFDIGDIPNFNYTEGSRKSMSIDFPQQNGETVTKSFTTPRGIRDFNSRDFNIVIFGTKADGWSGYNADDVSRGSHSVAYEEYFHNLVVRDSRDGTSNVVLTNDTIGIYDEEDDNSLTEYGQARYLVNAENDGATYVSINNGLGRWISESGSGGSAEREALLLGKETSVHTKIRFSNNSGQMVGYIGSFGGSEKFAYEGTCVAFNTLDGNVERTNCTNVCGSRIVLRNMNMGNFINFASGAFDGSADEKERYYTIMNMGNGTNGADNFFIGKIANKVVLQHEGNVGHYSGILFNSTEGLTLRGLSQETLDYIYSYVDSKINGSEFTWSIPSEPLVPVFEQSGEKMFRTGGIPALKLY